ncbi:hypothetical protein CDIK_2470 [Cucumispora dikerogammari]|nr:hypothetical protein CDIK_2470 [Cucumispora dikerogammari]
MSTTHNNNIINSNNIISSNNIINSNNNNNEIQKTYKITFLGSTSVGKTSIIIQYIYHNLTTPQSTVGIDYFIKEVSFPIYSLLGNNNISNNNSNNITNNNSNTLFRPHPPTQAVTSNNNSNNNNENTPHPPTQPATSNNNNELPPSDPINNNTINNSINNNNIKIKLKICDTAGQERFNSMISSYTRDSFITCIVFDLSTPYKDSIESINKWIENSIHNNPYINNNSNNSKKSYIIIVGNKSDLIEGYNNPYIINNSNNNNNISNNNNIGNNNIEDINIENEIGNIGLPSSANINPNININNNTNPNINNNINNNININNNTNPNINNNININPNINNIRSYINKLVKEKNYFYCETSALSIKTISGLENLINKIIEKDLKENNYFLNENENIVEVFEMNRVINRKWFCF